MPYENRYKRWFWNSGAQRLNHAFPKKCFDACGLVSLLDQRRRLSNTTGTAGYGIVRTVAMPGHSPWNIP